MLQVRNSTVLQKVSAARGCEDAQAGVQQRSAQAATSYPAQMLTSHSRKDLKPQAHIREA